MPQESVEVEGWELSPQDPIRELCPLNPHQGRRALEPDYYLPMETDNFGGVFRVCRITQ